MDNNNNNNYLLLGSLLEEQRNMRAEIQRMTNEISIMSLRIEIDENFRKSILNTSRWLVAALFTATFGVIGSIIPNMFHWFH